MSTAIYPPRHTHLEQNPEVLAFLIVDQTTAARSLRRQLSDAIKRRRHGDIVGAKRPVEHRTHGLNGYTRRSAQNTPNVNKTHTCMHTRVGYGIENLLADV